jgi:hypothetical protein
MGQAHANGLEVVIKADEIVLFRVPAKKRRRATEEIYPAIDSFPRERRHEKADRNSC